MTLANEKEPSNIDIALFALYRLGGAERPVDTEDIAIECWRLVPQRFSWKKYPQYPESDTTRVTLFDAAKPKYGKLVRGRKNKTGWMLTVNGIDYVKARIDLLGSLASRGKEILSRHTELDRYFAQLEKQPAYKKFLKAKRCEIIQRHEFTQLLQCSLDASPNILRDRLEKLRSRARAAGREDFLEFFDACEQYFGSMLSDD